MFRIMIKAVIFDLWETLAYRKRHLIHSLDELFKLPLGAKSLHKIEHAMMTKKFKSKKAAYIHICKEFKIEPSDTQHKKFEKLLTQVDAHNNIVIFDDVKPALRLLKCKGYKICLISNTTNFGMGFLKAKGLERYFEVEIRSYGAKMLKPDPKIFKLALKKLKVRPSEAVMVGDTYQDDVLVAKKVGMNAIWLLRKKHNSYSSTNFDYRYKIKKLDELGKILKKFQ